MQANPIVHFLAQSKLFSPTSVPRRLQVRHVGLDVGFYLFIYLSFLTPMCIGYIHHFLYLVFIILIS
jgi:hypothetical protein